LHACKNVYSLSHRELEQVLSKVSGKAPKSEKKKPAKPKKLTVQRKVGTKKLSVTGQGGRLTVSAAGLALDEEILNGLGDVIAEYLEKHRSK
jgi:ParB family chromosome partitioning protein